MEIKWKLSFNLELPINDCSSKCWMSLPCFFEFKFRNNISISKMAMQHYLQPSILCHGLHFYPVSVNIQSHFLAKQRC